jgi:aspartyl-tRNA synthetase
MKGTVQITVPCGVVSKTILEGIGRLQRESVIGIRGTIKKMPKAPRGVEIIPEELRILNIAKPLPFEMRGRARLDIRLDERTLDLRRPESRAIFRIRHATLNAIRSFLLKEGYMEIQTPKIIASATEGGAALFPIIYYGREAFLAQSPQLYKEQLASVYEKVFEIGPVFRAEEFHTTRHLCEITSVDIEEAFVKAEDVMRVLESMIAFVIEIIKTKCDYELLILKRRLEIPRLPFPRFTYDDILEELRREDIHITWGEDLPTPALRKLGRLHKDYYFITDWPTQSKPFYMLPRGDNPRICDAFDLMHGWIEIASGGTRIHTRKLLEKRIKEQGLTPESFTFHLKVFDYGMPPHAGWGLGLERLLMALTGKKNIREVIFFPRDPRRLKP